jgi:hypothetical protein
LIDSGGSSSGIVVLRLLDLFVRLEFMPVTLEEFVELVKFEDIGVIMASARELAKESLSPSVLLKRNSRPRAMEFALSRFIVFALDITMSITPTVVRNKVCLFTLFICNSRIKG